MTTRETRSVRVDPEVWSDFVSQVEEWEGQKHGELGRHVENALQEYVDNDRLSRLESKVDTLLDEQSGTHTHKGSPTDEKVEAIGESLGELDRVVIKRDDVRDAIESVAGADNRTVKKYKDLLKRRGIAYKHPTNGVWTLERDRWMKWAINHWDNNPSVEAEDIIDDYPMNFDEFQREATDVEEVVA